MGVGMSGLTADGRSLIKYVPSTPSLYLAPQNPSSRGPFAFAGTCGQRC
jgi:hypothetical protein